MNERFLCRGKRIDNGEWAIGHYYRNPEDRCFIYVPYLRTYDTYEVDPTTVGQCTGLHAAKSYRGGSPEDLLVFEGDMLYEPDYECYGTVFWGESILTWYVAIKTVHGIESDSLSEWVRKDGRVCEIVDEREVDTQ